MKTKEINVLQNTTVWIWETWSLSHCMSVNYYRFIKPWSRRRLKYLGWCFMCRFGTTKKRVQKNLHRGGKQSCQSAGWTNSYNTLDICTPLGLKYSGIKASTRLANDEKLEILGTRDTLITIGQHHYTARRIFSVCAPPQLSGRILFAPPRRTCNIFT